MRAYYGRKSFDVVGYTFNAEMYCADCVDGWRGGFASLPIAESPDNYDPPNPIFADQVTQGDECAECGGLL